MRRMLAKTNPNVQAFTDLLNRTLDKPREPEQTLNLGISEQTLQILDRWKTRNRQREELEAANGDHDLESR